MKTSHGVEGRGERESVILMSFLNYLIFVATKDCEGLKDRYREQGNVFFPRREKIKREVNWNKKCVQLIEKMNGLMNFFIFLTN